jgi:hypothetical protein
MSQAAKKGPKLLCKYQRLIYADDENLMDKKLNNKN